LAIKWMNTKLSQGKYEIQEMTSLMKNKYISELRTSTIERTTIYFYYDYKLVK